MNKSKKYQKAWTSGKMIDFLPYLYKMIRRENSNLPKLMPEKVMDWYNSDSDFKKYADEQLEKRRSIFSKNQSWKASIAGKNNVKNGIFGTADSIAQQALNASGWYGSEKQRETSRKSGSIGGAIAGAKNVASGHWAKFLEEYATFETRSRGGKTSGQNNVKSGHWAECQKLATKASIKSREAAAYDRRKIIIDQLPDDVEFTGKIVRSLCDKEGYSSWKAVLKDERFIIKTHHGPNQFNPSMYKKK